MSFSREIAALSFGMLEVKTRHKICELHKFTKSGQAELMTC